MIQLAKDAWQKTVVHRMTVGWILLFTVNALCTSIMAALAGTQWSDVDRQTKFLIVISVVASWTNTMAAFFNQAVSRVKQGEDIVPPTK